MTSESEGVNYLDARSIGSLERGYHSYMKHLNIQITNYYGWINQ